MDEIRRERQIAGLREGKRYDLLIVGGGATGLGTAVDAALRGYRVALVERADFGKGTSSRSTKLVHGGVRYLKQGNLALVRDALRERGRLLRNAPHVAGGLEFVIPAYSQMERAFYGLGLKGYDLLAGRESLGRSRMLGRRETLERLPGVSQKGLIGGVLYYDGQFDDTRMTTNLMQTFVELGGTVVNYCECVSLLQETTGRLGGAMVRDVETGEELEIRAGVVVNATGVFVDELRQCENADTRPMVAVSQGIHVVLPRQFLPGDNALMIPKTADGRVLFAVPWHGCLLVGTTDTPVRNAVMEPRALPEEYDFVMSHAAKYLERPPKDDDVLSVFAGLRPLVRDSGGERNTAALSRDHTIVVGKGGMVTVTGGKWTTYREMAEEVVDRAEEVAGWTHRASRTANFPVHGAIGCGVFKGHRLALYGSDAAKILQDEAETGGAQWIHPELGYSTAEVRWQARHEMAITVEDVLARRTRALFLNARAAAEAAPVVAEILAKELGREEGWAEQQVEQFRALAKGYHPPA